ncbi:MAG: phosphatase PAP2 family protein [Chloroflexi bacterium]|nr:phosphatase PAP2 family protein [Chloroflexota bacterium]
MARFAIAALLAIVLLVLVYAVFVQTEAGQRIENLGLEGAALRSAAERADSLGQLSLVRLVPFALAMVLIVLAASARRRSTLGLTVVGAMVTAVIANEVLKELLPRPALVQGPAWLLRNSFPSGTTAVATAVAVGLLLVSPGRLRWLAMPAAALLAAIIGQATQIAGWHRMSDAVGAVLLVTAFAAAALAGLAAAGFVRASGGGRINRRVRTAVVVAGAVSIIIGLLVLLIALAFPVLRAPTGASGAFLHTTFDLVGAGITILIVVSLGIAIEPFSLGRSALDPGPEPGPQSSVIKPA